jgi:uncharacterized protein (TIGR02677 family)
MMSPMVPTQTSPVPGPDGAYTVFAHRNGEKAWTGLRRWFIGDGAPFQAELLRARARSAIPALLTAVTQINDRRSHRADRAADFSTLARWFAQAPDDNAAHRLWRVASALAPARTRAGATRSPPATPGSSGD